MLRIYDVLCARAQFLELFPTLLDLFVLLATEEPNLEERKGRKVERKEERKGRKVERKKGRKEMKEKGKGGEAGKEGGEEEREEENERERRRGRV